MIGEAANELTDAAGRAVGKYKRHKFRKKVEDSPLQAVDDPAAAAVIMMYAAAQDAGPVTAQVEEAIRREVATTMGIREPTEVMVFAKWVAGHVADANSVSMRYAKLWAQKLNLQERRDFHGMVQRVMEESGTYGESQTYLLARLAERLALTSEDRWPA
ncbi:MAG: hypothetical protein KDK75_20445 [Alphaproteobacteria bacterium]|nr:hypothetical protein [Alphaproteobacteria bacterium]